MTTKTRTRTAVEFYATSPRVAQAFRFAAKHNKKLTHCAWMHEIGRSLIVKKASKPIGIHSKPVGIHCKVVLSHVDEDHLPVTAKGMNALTGAFHLLFTEPSTHPDQVAQWMRTNKIRSKDPLHVVKVEDLQAPQVSFLLGRICSALGRDGTRGSIIDAYLAGNSLLVLGPKHRMIHVPVSSVPALSGQSQAVLRNFEIDADGSFIHWPDIDVHLGWNQFLQAIDPEEFRKAQQRSKGFNERYGAAIRRVRELARISQSSVENLTERQLRRIEQGESRATTNALTALAVAHGLELNEYLERLSKAMD
jgi:hypothetical protein